MLAVGRKRELTGVNGEGVPFLQGFRIPHADGMLSIRYGHQVARWRNGDQTRDFRNTPAEGARGRVTDLKDSCTTLERGQNSVVVGEEGDVIVGKPICVLIQSGNDFLRERRTTPNAARRE